MAQDDIDTVIGERCVDVDINNAAVRRRHHRIDRLAAFVALHAADVQAFVDLPAFRADTTEGTTGPGFAGGRDEKFFLLARVVNCAIRGRKKEDVGARRHSEREKEKKAKQVGKLRYGKV